MEFQLTNIGICFSIKKSVILLEKSKVGYNGHYYLLIPDHASGRKNSYTVYRIPASPSRRIKIIGQELPLFYAKKYVIEYSANKNELPIIKYE